MSALLKEISLRKEYLQGESIESIYWGGGTPSLIPPENINEELNCIRQFYNVAATAELTLEANPDDITIELLEQWTAAGINRLSIGVQSFFEEDLRWMNRAHSAGQAQQSLEWALRYFDNISMDLIYGSPGLTNEKWKENITRAIELQIPHLSCYALTVEPETPLNKMIRLKQSLDVNPDQQAEQFLILIEMLEQAGYEHYEISNFAKPGKRSRHNSSYWQGKKYLGLGPSAHSFDGTSRQWNISNNQKYIEAIENGFDSGEKEILTETQKVNEYIMTSVRTMEGLHLDKLPVNNRDMVLTAAKNYITRGLMIQKNEALILTREGKLYADGIAASLFL